METSAFIEWIKIIYYISNPLLVILGFIALLQIWATIKTSKISSKRNSATLAAKQCEIFSSEIMPLFDDLSKTEKELGLKTTVFLDDLDGVLDDKILQSVENYYPNIVYKQKVKIAINKLESFAIYFTKGVADKEIAFSSVGIELCNYVKRYSLLIAYEINQNKNKFTNLNELYNQWKIEIKDIVLENEILEHNEILDNLKKRKNEVNMNKKKSQRPIGT